MKILIGADIVPTESNYGLFNEGKVLELVGEELYELIKEASFRIFNLETPLSDVANPIKKGYHKEKGGDLVCLKALPRKPLIFFGASG